jgi:hypothetical protein
MKASPKKLLPLTLFAIAVTASLFSVRPAQAYTVTLEQVGPNVVATGSGAFDLTGLQDPATALAQSLINPFLGNIITGSSNPPGGACDAYGGAFAGPSTLGGGPQTFASNGTGDIAGMLFNGGNPLFTALLVPEGYVSGTALSDSATYELAVRACGELV